MQRLNKRLMRVICALSSITMVLFFSSCKDEPAEGVNEKLFGDNLINAEMYVTSAGEVTAKTETSETIEFNSINYLMLGEYNDPTFGSIKADFTSELSLGLRPTKELNYSEDVEYVSTEFRIKYGINSWIGDTLAKHKISVYELTTKMDRDIDYKANFDPEPLFEPSDLLGELSFVVKNGAVDSAWATSGYIHTLAIPVKDEVGLNIFEADSATITNPEAFRELFNGVYVTTEKEDEKEGSLLRLNYESIGQELAVIYRLKKTIKDHTGTVDSIAYDTIPKTFPVNKESAKVVTYKRNYDNSNVDLISDDADKIYLQGMGGTIGKVNITEEFINEWKSLLPEPGTNSNELITSISSVELSFYADTTINKNLPQSLSIFIKNSKGNLVTPTFETSENGSSSALNVFSGGAGKVTSDGAFKYTFSFQTGFFEEFIHPTISINGERAFKELYLTVPSPNFSLNRVVLHGMSISKSEEDKSIQPSNLSVRYVEVE